MDILKLLNFRFTTKSFDLICRQPNSSSLDISDSFSTVASHFSALGVNTLTAEYVCGFDGLMLQMTL